MNRHSIQFPDELWLALRAAAVVASREESKTVTVGQLVRRGALRELEAATQDEYVWPATLEVMAKLP